MTTLPHSEAYKNFEERTRDPEKYDRDAWNRIWAEIGASKFWQARQKGTSPQLLEFPITDYSDYKNAIERSFQSGQNELASSPIIFWSQSSGTTGQRKLFPLTEAYRAEFQQITPPQIYGLAKRFPNFANDPFLFIVASAPKEKSPSGIEVGFISHFNYRSIPDALRKQYAWPMDILKSDETIYTWGPLYALAANLGAIAAITPAVVTQLGERINTNWQTYYAYLTGTKSLPPELPPLPISSERRAALERIHTLKEKRFSDMWPHLKFVTCWTSSTAGLQVPALQKYLGPTIPIVDGAYCATEGWMTVPLSSENGGVLMPGSHIVEFSLEGEDPTETKLLRGSELEIGKKYEVFLTNSMGLIRYRLFDVVRCNGFFNKSPIIEFTHKSGSMIAIGQVRFAESNLILALQFAELDLEPHMVFGIAVDGAQLVCYTANSFDTKVTKLQKVQQYLAKVSPEYQEDIDAGLMRPLSYVFVPKDHAFWQKIQKSNAQSKQPLITLETYGAS